jgi:hypothetical protein
MPSQGTAVALQVRASSQERPDDELNSEAERVTCFTIEGTKEVKVHGVRSLFNEINLRAHQGQAERGPTLVSLVAFT